MTWSLIHCCISICTVSIQLSLDNNWHNWRDAQSANRMSLFQRQNNLCTIISSRWIATFVNEKNVRSHLITRDAKNINLFAFRKSQFHDWIKTSKSSKLISYFEKFIIICIDAFRTKLFLRVWLRHDSKRKFCQNNLNKHVLTHFKI